MRTRYKLVYGGNFHKNHRILYSIIIFLWKWNDRIKYKWTYVINKNNYRRIFKKSLIGALIDFFWAIFYPLAIIKETLWRLFWRGVYKAGFFMEYLQYKFSKKEPEPPIDLELIGAINNFSENRGSDMLGDYIISYGTFLPHYRVGVDSIDDINKAYQKHVEFKVQEMQRQNEWNYFRIVQE